MQVWSCRPSAVSADGHRLACLHFLSLLYHDLREVTVADGAAVMLDYRDDGLCGVIDTLGNWLIQPEYKSVTAYREFAIVTNPGVHMMVDYSGNILEENLVDYVSSLDYWTNERYVKTDGTVGVVNEQLASGMFAYYVGNLCGLMDAHGHRITPPVYKYIEAESSDLFTASIHDSGSHVILNRQGKVVN